MFAGIPFTFHNSSPFIENQPETIKLRRITPSDSFHFFYPCGLSGSLFSFSPHTLLWPLSLCVSLCLLSCVEAPSSQSEVSDGTQRICLSVAAHVLLFKNNKLSKTAHVFTRAYNCTALLNTLHVCVWVCLLYISLPLFHFHILNEREANFTNMTDRLDWLAHIFPHTYWC